MPRTAIGFLTLTLLSACLAAGSTPPGINAPIRHVVVITVDGLRPGAIDAAFAPNIRNLAARGAVSMVARTVEPPETLPVHVSMVTGLRVAGHGVTHNKARGGSLKQQTVFTRVRAAGGRSANYVGKSKLSLMSDPDFADTLWGAGQDGQGDDAGKVHRIAERFARDFPKERFDFAWVHLREPDWAGHKHGWMSAKYLAALRDADAAVGVVLKAISDAGLQGATAILLTSDHGGEQDGHWSGGGDATFLIPWICVAPGLAPGTIAAPVSAVDLAPTVLAWLGLPPLDRIDGAAVRACLP